MEDFKLISFVLYCVGLFMIFEIKIDNTFCTILKDDAKPVVYFDLVGLVAVRNVQSDIYGNRFWVGALNSELWDREKIRKRSINVCLDCERQRNRRK